MNTPSHPLLKARSICCGSTRDEHNVFMTTPFGGYFIRDVPARSAPEYVHHLHKKQTIFGSKSFIRFPTPHVYWTSLFTARNYLDHIINLVISKVFLLCSAGWTCTDTCATTLTEYFINFYNFGNFI